MADLTDIETFVSVARSGSFAGAARNLGLSPAMVGRRIQALENRHGVRLIERTTRAQRLTEMGENFLGRAETLLEAAGELDELTRSTAGSLSGRLRISGPTTLGIKRLPPILAGFTERHPYIVIEMVLSDRRVDLIADGFDLAVRIGELRDSTMVARRVGTYRFAVCASPDYLARHGTPRTPEELTSARCILNLNISPRNRWPFVGPGGGTVTVEVSGPIEIDNGEALRAAALAGGGLVYLPLDLAAEDPAAAWFICPSTLRRRISRPGVWSRCLPTGALWPYPSTRSTPRENWCRAGSRLSSRRLPRG
jgi:DNA-binding transcriptional LysR family regulator